MFDESGQPVKTGVLRLTFDPPLFTGAAPPPAPAPGPSPPFNCSVFGCTCQGASDFYGIVAGSGFGCTSKAAETWWTANQCGTSPKTGGNCDGPACRLPNSAPCTPCPHCVPPPPPSPPPTQPTGFAQTLHLANSTVTIVTKTLTVQVWYDLNAALRNGVADQSAAILHVTATATARTSVLGPHSGIGVKVTLEPYRVEGRPSGLGAGLCDKPVEHADTVSTATRDTIVWHHYNRPNDTQYYTSTTSNQGVDPKSPGLSDAFSGRSWGASVSGIGLTGPDASGLSLTGVGLPSVDIQVTLLTLAPQPTEEAWLDQIGKVTAAPPASPTSPVGCSGGHSAPCATTWDEVSSRSYIEVTAADPTAAVAATQITNHVAWDRYLSLIQGRRGYAPLKFNGQQFNCNNTGKGWDARDWGAGYWWQNTRQPYYNVLQQGDIDTSRSFLDFYLSESCSMVYSTSVEPACASYCSRQLHVRNPYQAPMSTRGDAP